MVRERKTKKHQKSALEKLIVKRRKSALEKLIVKRKSALEKVKVGGRRRTRKTRRRRRGGGTYDETPVSDGEHKIIMKENYEKLLRYYGAHAKGHSRDPFGSNAAKAKRDILNTLKKYQCKIPELQASLLKKYGAAPKLTDDLRHPEARSRYNCGQVGGRRRSRHRRRRRKHKTRRRHRRRRRKHKTRRRHRRRRRRRR